MTMNTIKNLGRDSVDGYLNFTFLILLVLPKKKNQDLYKKIAPLYLCPLLLSQY